MVRKGSPVRVRKRALKKPPLRRGFLCYRGEGSDRADNHVTTQTAAGRDVWRVLHTCAPLHKPPGSLRARPSDGQLPGWMSGTRVGVVTALSDDLRPELVVVGVVK